MKQVIEKLREKGIVLTHQRLAVLCYLMDHRNHHPTATEVYQHLRKKYPTISQATIYSTLDLLRKMGQVRELFIQGNQSCYDVVEEVHYHLFCRECRRIFDVKIPCPSLDRDLLQGHKIDDIELYLYGLCRDCLRAEGDQTDQDRLP